MESENKVKVENVCKKIMLRLLDVDIGSTNGGEDIFTSVLNRYEVVQEAKKHLIDYNKGSISKQELKENLSKIGIENDIEAVDNVFYDEYTTFGEQFDWLFEDDLFEEFLYEPFERIIESNITLKGIYESYRDEFENL